MAGGASPAEATSALGMLQGMVLPVLFLPGIFTAAVGMVGAPAIARRQGRPLRLLAGRLLAAALGYGVLGGLAVYAAAPFLANTVYRLPPLTPLFRSAAPLTLLFALQQAAGTLLSGLGEQKKTLMPTLAGTALMLVCVYRLAATPLGVYGAVYALLMGRAVSLLLQLAAALPLLTGSAAPAGP